MSLVEKKSVETNKFELTIAVPAEELEAACQKVYRKRVKNIEVPGFRKGKAPRATIEKIYGEGVFFEDAINELYPIALEAAVREAELDLVAAPQVEVTEVSKENGFSFKAVCVVKPEVSIKDYKGLNVKKDVKSVAEEDVAEELKRMQERNARTIAVEGRAAENGDTVVFDFEGSVDGVPFDGGKAEKFSLELGSGQFIPGFEDQIVGHQVGDEFDVNVTFPEEYHAEELKGKAAVFKCKLHELNAKELPELDDEFAKDVSEFDTLADLKADIEKKISEKNEKDAETAYENALIDAVIEKMEADIPQEMIEARIDDMIRDFSYRLQSQGMSLELYLQYTGMTMEGFRETFAEQAKKQVEIRLALEKIVELEAIEVTEEELEAEYKRIAEAYQMELDQVKPMIPAEDLKKDVASNKAIDLIKSTAIAE